MAKLSPFLEPRSRTDPDTLAIALLSRDVFQPVTLERSTGAVDGYAEGATLNTRFGSFPHSTLLDIPWGSQVRASKVDTGSRGRKRRRDDTGDNTPVKQDEDASTPAPKQEDVSSTPAKPAKAIMAATGFIHILRPSPELWTSSLPHRTQVVYTPDYSYILHRIRARPGTRIIEAGAGSGSFTHASARAVYSGYPTGPDDKRGGVSSFEFHEPRFQKLQEEIKGHGLEGIVHITHRDVCHDGFLVDGKSPLATAVFLDLPAPWEAIPHLIREKPRGGNGSDDAWVSPLDPSQSVYICSFSPCIEQVQRTMNQLRAMGWTDVDMVEISHKRINVPRERIGIGYPNEKGLNPSPADVTEAVTRLRDINRKTQAFHKATNSGKGNGAQGDEMDVDTSTPSVDNAAANGAEKSVEGLEKPWMQGRLVHRTESEVKTHTSYLVFAILPPVWDQESEAAAEAKWPCGNERKTIGSLDKEAFKQYKRDMVFTKKQKRPKGAEMEAPVP